MTGFQKFVLSKVCDIFKHRPKWADRQNLGISYKWWGGYGVEELNRVDLLLLSIHSSLKVNRNRSFGPGIYIPESFDMCDKLPKPDMLKDECDWRPDFVIPEDSY